MTKSLQNNRVKPFSLHDKFNMKGITELDLNFKMESVVEFNLTNPSADCLGVNPQFVFLNYTSWG
jgi:hypothetical protein